MYYLVLLLGMIVAYAGRSSLMIPRGVIIFLVSTKVGPGVMCICEGFAGSYSPPPVEIMNGPFKPCIIHKLIQFKTRGVQGWTSTDFGLK